MKITTFATLVLFCHFASAQSQARLQIRATPLTATTYLLEGDGGNMVASIGRDGVFLVDDDFDSSSEALLTKLKELNGAIPKYIVNTHFHYDHTGGNLRFGNSTKILAADNVRARLSRPQVLWNRTHPAYPELARPSLTFKNNFKLKFNGEEIELLHLPAGHTDGDTVVFFKKYHVIAMGDLYFAGMFPIYHPEHGGSLFGYLRNLKKVFSLAPNDSKIVPGHGPVTTREDLKEYIKMFQLSIDLVSDGIRKGESLTDIQKRGLDARLERYSHGYRTPAQWMEQIYKSLKSPRSPVP
jgi:glyoxylase-like metal-dependent hydrolase (beta-lactamase superfamily II)